MAELDIDGTFDDGFVYTEVALEPEIADDADPDAELSALVAQLAKGQGSPAAAYDGGAGYSEGMRMPPSPGGVIAARPAVADDYIRNFLIRAGMNRSLDCFNTEWYEMKSTGALPPDDLQRIPDAYAQNHLLEEEVARLRTELVHAREIAGRAQATWDKFRKERDFHRMHHKRVVQEKNRLIVDLRRLRAHYEKYEPLLGELKSKYELAMKEKMLTRLDRDRQAARVAALESTLAAGEGGGEGGLGASMAAGGTSRAHQQHKETVSPPRSQSAMTQGAPTASKDKRDAATVMFAKQAPTGVLSHTAASRARWLDRLQSGPLPPVVAHAQAAAQAATAARAKALRVPDSRLPSEDQVNPYLNVLFEPARASSYKLTGTVAAHGGTVGALAFHPSKPLVVSGSDDGTWRMWAVQSAAEAELIMNGEGHKAWVADVDFHPGGASLATCAGDGVVKIWDLLTARCAATFSDHLQTTWGVAWHGDGAFLATASMDHTARLFDVPTGRVRQTFRGHVDSVNAVAWQPFSVNLATGSGDKTVSMWDARSGLCIQTFYGHTNSVNDVAFNLRGDAIASCDADGVVRMWDIRMVAERGSVALGRQPVHSLSFDRSGTVLAAGCEDGVVRILDASGAGGAGLALAESLRGHEDGVQAVAFDPSAQYLVSGGADRTVRIWSEGALKGVGIPLEGGGGGGGREERAPSPGPDGDD